MRAPMDFGMDIAPAEVSQRTRSPSSVTLEATIRRPFLSTMVSAAAEDTASNRSDAMGAAGRTPEFYPAGRPARARSFRADALSNTACPAVQARRREPTAIRTGVRQT